MKKSQVTTTAAILFAVATMGIGLANAQGSASANGAKAPQERPFDGERRHNDMNAAIEATDYQSFVDAVGTDAPILDIVTADNFEQFKHMHELMQSGDRDGAKAIAEELGLPQMGPMQRGGGQGNMGTRGDRGPQLTAEQRSAVDAALEAGDYNAFIAAHPASSNIASRISEEQFQKMVTRHAERDTHRAAVDAAIDARDYNAFVEAVGPNAPFLDQINETNFPQFAEMHDLMQAGDWEGAKAIADELGIPTGHHGERAFGMGETKGQGDMMRGMRGQGRQANTRTNS